MGDRIRAFWRFMCVVCCLVAFVLVFINDPTGAIVTVLSGAGFFAMSEWPHTDLDAL